jgi:hypothetical protein
MEASTKKKVLIIVSLLAIAGGVVGFVLYKKKKVKEQKKKEEEEKLAAESKTNSDSKSYSQPSSGSSSSSSTDRPADITAFQKYAKSKGADLGISGTNKDGIDGVWGGKTTTAWATYGAEYTKSISAETPEQKEARKKKLWAEAIKASSATFVFDGKIYNTTTGKEEGVTGSSAIGKTAKVKGSNAKIRSEARAADEFFDNTYVGLINAPNVIGKIKNLTKGADGFMWYEVDLSTPPMVSPGGFGNPYAKVGWVREDVIKIS